MRVMQHNDVEYGPGRVGERPKVVSLHIPPLCIIGLLTCPERSFWTIIIQLSTIVIWLNRNSSPTSNKVVLNTNTI